MNGRPDFWYFAAIVIISAFVFFCIWYTTSICEDAGGVPVRGGSGYVCIDKGALR